MHRSDQNIRNPAFRRLTSKPFFFLTWGSLPVIEEILPARYIKKSLIGKILESSWRYLPHGTCVCQSTILSDRNESQIIALQEPGNERGYWALSALSPWWGNLILLLRDNTKLHTVTHSATAFKFYLNDGTNAQAPVAEKENKFSDSGISTLAHHDVVTNLNILFISMQ